MTSDKSGLDDDRGAPLDTSTHDQFFQYYAQQSQSPETVARFERLVDLVLKIMDDSGRVGPFRVADIGGGAGTLALTFARAGHAVTCVDISKDLLEVGKARAAQEGLAVDFVNCSATDTPLPDASVDVCVVPELLEHVVDWRESLDEASRILRPGGLLFLSTTNKLCPVQQEFNLPCYSWYPAFLKRRYERLAVTTRPEVANYAKFPAVNWFTYYSLRKALLERDFNRFMDRLDMIEVRMAGSSSATLVKFLRHVPLMRLFTQFLTNGSYILGVKRAS